MSRRINIASPNISKRDIFEVVRVLSSGKLAQGEQVKKFESEFSKLVQDRHCVAVNSGTSALHLALLSIGIGPGDEVIVPSFSFAASANTIALTGAKPVFADINLDTFNISLESIKQCVTKRTKAIMVVHLYGLPADMQEITEFAAKSGLRIIEDAAQAHGSSIAGRPVGTFGDVAAFSFYPTKNMTSGEGGMIVLKDEKGARLARLLRNQGMETRYQNEIVGYNLRMTDIHAALGRSQLRNLQKWTAKRIFNANYLCSGLESEHLPIPRTGVSHVYHQFSLLLDFPREEFIELMNHRGVEIGVYYPTPIHKLESFRHLEAGASLENTLLACESVVSLPVHPKLRKKDLDLVIRSFNEVASILRNRD